MTILSCYRLAGHNTKLLLVVWLLLSCYWLDDDNTELLLARCVDHCLRSGFIFAGLQYGVECFCGNHLPGDKSKAGRNLRLESVNMATKCHCTQFSNTLHLK